MTENADFRSFFVFAMCQSRVEENFHKSTNFMLFGFLAKLVKVFKRLGVWGKGNFLQKVSLSPYIIL